MTCNMSHLMDPRTHSIVYWFIKYSKAFSVDLASVIISYVGDHFIPNRGSFTWFIEDSQLDTIKQSPPLQLFCSPPFIIAGMQWQLNLYPNGTCTDNIGALLLYLKLLSKPQRGDTVVIHRKLICHELHVESSFIVTHQKGISLGWNQHCLSFQQFQNTKSKRISLSVELCILRIVDISQSTFSNKVFLYQHRLRSVQSFPRQQIEWKLDHSLLERMRLFESGQHFESGEYHQMWCLMVYPKGLDKERNDHFEIGLQIIAFPSNISRLSVRYQMFVDEFGIHTDWTRTFDICSHSHIGWLWSDLNRKVLDSGTFMEMQLNEMNIMVDIEVLEMWNNNGMKIARKQWSRFVKT